MIDEAALEDWLPRLRSSGYRITSPPTDNYNCIAWAVGETAQWWSPIDDDDHYWPAELPRQLEDVPVPVEGVTSALATVGFVECEGAAMEDGYEKVAIFADEDGFTHVARQMPSGRWTSKLGQHWDIEHELDAMAGFDSAWPSFRYGEIALIMRRPRVSPGEGANLQ